MTREICRCDPYESYGFGGIPERISGHEICPRCDLPFKTKHRPYALIAFAALAAAVAGWFLAGTITPRPPAPAQEKSAAFRPR